MIQDNELVWFRGSNLSLPHAEQATWRGHHIGTGEYQTFPFIDEKPCVYRLILHFPSGQVMVWFKRKVEAEFELLGPFPWKDFSNLSNRQEAKSVVWSPPMTAKVLHLDQTWSNRVFKVLHMPWETVASVAQSELLHSTRDCSYCDLATCNAPAEEAERLLSPAVTLMAVRLGLTK